MKKTDPETNLWKAHVRITNKLTRVGAATAVGSLLALKEVVKKDRSSLWKKSHVFRYPLKAAALAGHSHIVKALVSQANADSQTRHTILPLSPEAVTRAITAAIAHRHAPILGYLPPTYQDFFGAPGDIPTKMWLLAAIRVGDKNVLRKLLAMKHQADFHTLYDAYKLACTNICLKSCRVFFETALEIDSIYTTGSKVPFSSNLTPPVSTYPLATAISACKPSVV